MDNLNVNNYIRHGMSKWYFYSDTESSIIGKLEMINEEVVNIDNHQNTINITFYDGHDLLDYLYIHKGIKLFIKREYIALDCTSGEHITLIEKFSSTDFNISQCSCIGCDTQTIIDIDNVQFLGRRQSAVKEIHEFW